MLVVRPLEQYSWISPNIAKLETKLKWESNKVLDDNINELTK